MVFAISLTRPPLTRRPPSPALRERRQTTAPR